MYIQIHAQAMNFMGTILLYKIYHKFWVCQITFVDEKLTSSDPMHNPGCKTTIINSES